MLSNVVIYVSLLKYLSRPEDFLQPRVVVDVRVLGNDSMRVTLHCGGQPTRYETATIVVLHARRNSAVPNSLENELLAHINSWPNQQTNDAILTVVDDFIARVPHFYKDSATKITMWTEASGKVEYNFEEDRNALPDYPDVPPSLKGVRRVRISDLTKVEALGHRSDLVVWRGDHLVFTQIGYDDFDPVLREVNLLSRRLAGRVIPLTAVVVDSADFLRGFLTPFNSNGNLANVFKNASSSSSSPGSSSFKLGGPISFDTKLKWGQQITQTVSDLHRGGVILGNLSPSSVLVGSSGDIVLCDLSGRASTTKGSSNWKGWLSPEASSSSIDDKSSENALTSSADIYCLGGLLWIMAAEPRDQSAWSSLPHSKSARSAAESSSGATPNWYKALYEACLSDDPSHRPKASEVLEALSNNGKGNI